MDKTNYVHKMEKTMQEMEIKNITHNRLNKLIEKVKHLLRSKFWPHRKKNLLF